MGAPLDASVTLPDTFPKPKSPAGAGVAVDEEVGGTLAILQERRIKMSKGAKHKYIFFISYNTF
jgi:hypothetical protein